MWGEMSVGEDELSRGSITRKCVGVGGAWLSGGAQKCVGREGVSAADDKGLTSQRLVPLSSATRARAEQPKQQQQQQVLQQVLHEGGVGTWSGSHLEV
jgi:hypothetical protein